ncbi:hypothetical protein PG993_004239 [Apiospora rasikravindrae]|uniref:Uncharacterized protein n=1 Tax=Apiospora rasikravindrae TaxID=990691 RepID=A0ABR1TC91_9PEZI
MSVTRNVLGPLTTVFTPDPTCVTPMAGYCQSQYWVAWQGQVCTPLANPPAGPPYTPGAATTDVAATGYLGGWGFYSPGLACPSGSTSACSKTADDPDDDDGFTFQFPLTAGETAVGCCPTSFSCVLDASGRNTCLRTVRSTVYDVVSCGGTAPPGTVTGTWYATSTTYHNIYAPLIQINWRAEDLPARPTNSAAATTASGPTNSVAPPTSSPSDNPAPSGLSSGAYAGIGVGAALGGLILLGGAIGGGLLLRRRRKAQDGSIRRGVPKGPTTNQDARHQQQQQRPASNIYEVSEMGHTRETHELFTPSPDGGSTSVERQQYMGY